MTNISNLLKFKTLNIEAATNDVEEGSGTFTNIIEKVYDGTISALIDNDGNIVGINYATNGSDNDNIEQAKFMKAYISKPVEYWASKAFEIYQNNDSYDEVIENDDEIKVILSTGEEIIIDDYSEDDYDDYDAECTSDEENGLPEEVDIDFNDDDYEGFDYLDDSELTMKYIKKYLRNKYGHYLSGFADDPTYEVDLDNEVIHVSDIYWGRKI